MGSALTLTATVGNGLPHLSIDAEEVRRAFELIMEPDGRHQIFTWPSKRKENIGGDDLDGAVEAVRRNEDQSSIWVTLNPISPETKGYANNQDILERRWLFIDLDPIRSEGFENHCASDAEHDLTKESAYALRNELAEMYDWPEPIIVDSGNGHYLWYRTQLANDKITAANIKNFLKAIAGKVEGNAKVDIAISDARRLARVPGTWNRGKLQAEGRIWRQCRLVCVPDKLGIVTTEQLAELSGVGEKGARTHPSSAPRPTKSALMLTAGSSNKDAYVRRAIDLECEAVASAQAGERNDRLNKAAFNLGGFVSGNHVSRIEIEQRLYESARECGLEGDPNCGDRGIRATIASGLDAGLLSPRIVPDREPAALGLLRTDASNSQVPSKRWFFVLDDEVIADGEPEEILQPVDCGDDKNPDKIFQIYTGPTLMRTRFDDPSWVIQGVLSEGLNILAGKPKMGKSILALNLALTISGGGLALGNTAVEQGDVLYLALEDKFRRIQSRASKMTTVAGMQVSKHFALATEWPRCDAGGLLLLDKWLKVVSKPRLIIIDVWPQFKPSPKLGSRKSAYDEDYAAFGDLKKFCDNRGVNCLVLLHCRKGVSEDVLDEVSGTLGQVGASDGILVLNRSRTNNEASIFVCGRDVDEQELALSFDLPTLTWKSLGPSAEYVRGKLQDKIIEYLKTHEPSTVKAIADGIGSGTESVRKVLNRWMMDAKASPVRQRGNTWHLADETEF